MNKIILSFALITTNSFAQSLLQFDNHSVIILNTFKQILSAENSNSYFSDNKCFKTICESEFFTKNKATKKISVIKTNNNSNIYNKYIVEIFIYSKNNKKEYTIICEKNNECKFFNLEEDFENLNNVSKSSIPPPIAFDFLYLFNQIF